MSFLKNFCFQNIKYFLIKTKYNFNDLNRAQFDWSKKTVFIFGGSWESSKLKKRHWCHIKKNVSIGINQWFLHKFEPDFLSIENSSKLGSSIRDYFNIQLIKFCKNTKTKILIKDLEFSFFKYSKLYPFRSKIFLVRKNYVPGITQESLVKAFKYFPQFNQVNYKGLFLSCRASVITAISIARFFNAKKIVLIGFGSLSSKYFWEVNKNQLRKKMLKPINLNQRNTQTTFDKQIFPITLPFVLKTMKAVFCEKEKAKILIGTPSLKLKKIFNIYKWPKTHLETINKLNKNIITKNT